MLFCGLCGWEGLAADCEKPGLHLGCSRGLLIDLHVIGGGGSSSTSSGPVGVEELTTRFVDALIGMRTKVIALGLQQVGGQALTAVAIEIVECGGNSGSGDAVHYSSGHYTTPAVLCLVHHILKEGIEQEVGQVFVLVVGFFDFA